MIALIVVLLLGPAAAPLMKQLERRAGAAPDETPKVSDGEPVLSCRDIYVEFGGLQALGGVDLDVYEGEIVGLIGRTARARRRSWSASRASNASPAGASSTAARTCSRVRRPPAPGWTSGARCRNVRLFPYLTVLDNVKVALHRDADAGTVAHALSLPTARDDLLRSVFLAGASAGFAGAKK